MGKWVIFIGDEKFTPETIKGMTFEGNTGTRDYGEKQFDVLYNEGYVSFQFDYDGMIIADYPPEFVKSLPFDSPQFILAKYSKQSLLERVISSKDFPEDVLIDCDGVELGLERIIDESRLVRWGWVIFIGDEKFTPQVIKGMTFEGNTGTRDYGEKQFDVLYNEDYVSFQFDYDRTLIAEYPPKFVESLPFDSPNFILARYSKQSLLERIISSKDFPEDVLIDCDGVELGLERIIDESRLVSWDEDEYLNHIIISL